MTRPRLLFLAHLLPWPLTGGGQIKSYHTLRALSSVYDITLLAFIRRANEHDSIAPFASLCRGGIHLVHLPRGKDRDARSAARALLQNSSFVIFRDASGEMSARVQAELATEQYAAVHVDHLQMMQFVPTQLPPRTKLVLDNHNVEHRIPQRMAETSRVSPLVRGYLRREWPRLQQFERDACRRADMVLTVSEADRACLAALVPEAADKIVSVPIGVDTEYFMVTPRKPGARVLLSVGTMYWPPNADSMRYFYHEIFPLVRAQVPDTRLCIVGARPPADIRQLAARDPAAAVTVTGEVPDIRAYAADCGVFIVPLRSGSGMRVKILSAFALGLPVVSSTLGAEGIDAIDGEHLLLADMPSAFADAVVRVLTDTDLSGRLGQAGRRLVEKQYAWEVVGKRLLSVYAGIVPPQEGA